MQIVFSPLIMVHLFFIIIILSAAAGASLEITEVMYAPLSGHEWVELYNPTDQVINITGWLLTDNKNTDQLGCCSFNLDCSLELAPDSYALILEQDDLTYANHSGNFTSADAGLTSGNANLTENNPAPARDNYTSNSTSSAILFCVDDNSLGNGLGNSGDNVTIHQGEYQFVLQYSSELGGNRNGRSLEKDGNSWRESYVLGGTPGKVNSLPQKENQKENSSLMIGNSSLPENTSSATTSNTAMGQELFSEPEAAANPVTAQPEASSKKVNPSFSITAYPRRAYAGDPLTIKFQIASGSSSHQFSAWAYVYRGSKCYSCGDLPREHNLQRISLDAWQEKIIPFELKLPAELESGEYSLKVRVIKDGQKTIADFKEKMVVEQPVAKKPEIKTANHAVETETALTAKEISFTATESAGRAGNNQSAYQPVKVRPGNSAGELLPVVAYESKGQKIKQIIPYFLAVSLGILAIVMVFKK